MVHVVCPTTGDGVAIHGPCCLLHHRGRCSYPWSVLPPEAMLLLRVMLVLVIRAAKETLLMSVVSDAIGGNGDV